MHDWLIDAFFFSKMLIPFCLLVSAPLIFWLNVSPILISKLAEKLSYYEDRIIFLFSSNNIMTCEKIILYIITLLSENNKKYYPRCMKIFPPNETQLTSCTAYLISKQGDQWVSCPTYEEWG